MEPSLGTLLRDRQGEDWLVGPSSQEFWRWLDQLTPRFAAYQAACPAHDAGVLMAEPDPLRFLATALAAWVADCTVVLANPHWGHQERQQVQALVNPQWGAPIQAGFGGYPCRVPGGEAGQLLIPTGGSSGQIKFAVHRWETLMVAIQGFRAHFGVDPVHAYCVLPLFHVSGLMQALRVLVSGGQLALQPYGDLKAGKRLALPPGGFLSLVPTQLQDLLAQGDDALPWLRGFRAVLLGGAPAWRSLLDQAQAQAIPLALTYGMTETAAQVATLLPEEFLAGHRSSGRPLPHLVLTIVDDQGRPRPAGQAGSILIKSGALAQGYLIRPKQGAATLAPAPPSLGTDDLGRVDVAGYLHIVGRSSTKIITGGENVFPEELEAVLLATGTVSDVCVVGLPCDRWGQQLCALVVMAPARLQDLPTLLGPQLAAYKRPKRWILVEALPRTAQGKLSRPQAQALAQQVVGGNF